LEKEATLKREALLGTATVLLCAVLYYETTLIADYGFAQVGADVWPKIILGVISALALLQIATGLIRPAPTSKADEGIAVEGWLFRAFVPITVFVGVVLFSLLVPYIGFTFSGLIMVFMLLSVIGPKSPRAIALHAAIAIVSVLSVTAFFTQVMGVLLPGWSL
jgi:hypothetical protein